MAARILVVDDSATIRRVVSTILERHGYEPALASDGEDAMGALASGEVKADLVLLDFVMPRMNGFQFCRALRENTELAATPVVLMSAKADKIRDQFVQQTGALDAITKPFDADALVAVVENVLRRVNVARASSARLPDFDDDASTAVGRVSEPPPDPEPESPPARRKNTMVDVFATKLASIAASVAEGDAKQLTPKLVEKLTPDVVLELVEVVRDVDRAGSGGSILSGDLTTVPIGAVLQLLQSENLSGVLVCRNGAAEIVAAVRNGAIDLVQASGAGDEFRIGRFFVEEGVLTPAQIDEVLAQAQTEEVPKSRVNVRAEDPYATIPGEMQAEQTDMPLGTKLLSKGKIIDSQLRAALTRQSSELLYEVLRWSRGRFELRREEPSALAKAAKLGLPVASVVMEGFRRVDEWRQIERIVGAFDTVPLRDDAALGAMDVASLPPREKVVLDLVDGERTVRAIIGESHMSSFDACRVLAQLFEARVLRRRS